MFAFYICFAELFYAVEVIGKYIDKIGLVFNICIKIFNIFLFRFRVRQVESVIKIYFSFKVNFIYKFEGLEYSFITSVA